MEREDFYIEGWQGWNEHEQIYGEYVDSDDYPNAPFGPNGLITPPDAFDYKYENPIIDELVKKNNYTCKGFSFNDTGDWYIITNRKEWMESNGLTENDSGVVPLFPYYGVESIEQFTKSLISLLITSGEYEEGFKTEIISESSRIAQNFRYYKGMFVKCLGDYFERLNITITEEEYELTGSILEGGF